MARMLAACVCCIGFAVGVPASAAGEPNWGVWAETVRKHHALAGSIYDVGLGGLTRPDPPNGRGLVLPTGIVLLGEVHDNPMHHRLRAWLIENTAKARREWRPAIVFEQIAADQQAALDQFKMLDARGNGSATADGLFRLLQWEKTGWPPAEIYRPLFEAAIAAKLPIYGGDPPRGRVRAVARGGLSPEERARLQLENPMPPTLLEALHRELEGSHCGVLPEAALSGMALAQRYRDAHLADALLTAAAQHGSAILVAGNGHVRNDRGVPLHLRQRAPKMGVTSFLIVEVEEGKPDPATYVPRDPDGRPAADYVIFTPRAVRSDPCENMRQRKP